MFFFPFGATAPIWTLAYLHETLRFISVYYISTCTQTPNIHALSGIRTHDPDFQASFRSFGYRNRHGKMIVL
jgi:hypothetical protein